MLTGNSQATVQPHQATKAATPDTPGHVTCTAAAHVFLVIIDQFVCSIVGLVMHLLLIIGLLMIETR